MAAPSRALRLTEGERHWLLVTELPFLVCALAALAWVPAQRPLNALVCIALVAGYAVATKVRVCLPGGGWASSSQLVFVPMLFIAPLNVVPLMVLAGMVISDLPRYASRRKAMARCALCLGDSWYALGPVVVLAAAGQETFAWTHWPVYALALAVGLTLGALAAWVRTHLHEEEREPLSDVVGVATVIDTVLTLPALSVVVMAAQAPIGAALTCAMLLVIAGGFTRQRSGRLLEHDHATHDPLTGLPNRLLFSELAAAATARARRDGEPCALMVVDLNDFKAVNDELGHEAGDRVLVQAANRLRESVRGADTVARLGGDEFAVLLAGHQSVDSCRHVTEKLRRAFDAPIDLLIGPRRVGVSIGTALIDGHSTPQTALHNADIAMYADKFAQGRRTPDRRRATEVSQRG